MISNLNSIDYIFLQGKVVAVFKHVTATTEGSYTCTSEGVSSKGVKVYVGEWKFKLVEPSYIRIEGVVNRLIRMNEFHRNQQISQNSELMSEKTDYAELLSQKFRYLGKIVLNHNFSATGTWKSELIISGKGFNLWILTHWYRIYSTAFETYILLDIKCNT